MSIALVQSASFGTGSSSSSASGTITLGSAPTAGNYLIFAYTYWNNLTATAPTGFTLLDEYDTTTGGQLGIRTYYRVVVAGDGTSISVGMSSSDDWGASVTEYSGVSGIESYANHTQNNGSTSTLVSASVTPTHLNDQFVVIFGQQGGSVDGATNSLSTGWTIDQSPVSRYNEGVMGHKNALTTDTTTAISVTDTHAILTRDVASTLIVLYPASSAVSATVAQIGATLMATGGTQAISASAIVSAAITQIAATLTVSGGTQTVATVRKVAISQVAANITATGGTQSIATVNNVNIAQAAATVTATGGTQAVSAGSIITAAITQVAGTITATGATGISVAPGFAFVQTKQSSSAGNTVITPTTPITQGNLVVVQLKYLSIPAGLTVTDSAGNAYALALGPRTGAYVTYQFYGVAVIGGATTITVSQSGTFSNRITVDEFSGNAQTNATVFDTAASANATGSPTAVSLAPASAGELISAVLNANTSTVAAGSGYTLALNSTSQATEYRLSGTTSETAPFLLSGTMTYTEIAGAYLPATQIVATVNIVAIAQVAGVITASGGTQVVAPSRFAAIAQSAAIITASGSTQIIATVNNVNIAQVAAIVTAAGGTQSTSAVRNVAITPTAATLTASGGTQAIATSQQVSITQVAATVTASGGTQSIATVNNVSIAQIAGMITATGGTQSLGSQINAAISQVVASVTASGGTQSPTAQIDAAIAQQVATVTAIGGTQTLTAQVDAVIAQLAATITANCGTQTVVTGGGLLTGDIKVYIGSSFVAKPVKIWNGSAWVQKPLKVYNGSAWVATNY